MKTEQAKQLAEQALEKLIEALEAGKSEALKAYLATMSRFHHYSFGNIMLIAFQSPTATHVAGFNTWKSMGRYVKKAERGITILAPIVVNRKNQENEVDEQTHSENALLGFKPVTVFDVSQTDGKPLPEFATVTGDPKDYGERLRVYITELGINLEYSVDIAPAKGISSGGKIVLLPDLAPADCFSTLVHEVSHELLHRNERRSETTRTIRETEAEAVAFVVSNAIGLDSGTASVDYIQLYRGDKQTLTESLHYIQQIASQILTAISPGD